MTGRLHITFDHLLNGFAVRGLLQWPSILSSQWHTTEAVTDISGNLEGNTGNNNNNNRGSPRSVV